MLKALVFAKRELSQKRLLFTLDCRLGFATFTVKVVTWAVRPVTARKVPISCLTSVKVLKVFIQAFANLVILRCLCLQMEYKYGSYGVQMYGGLLVEDGVLADMPLVGSEVKARSEFCGVFSKNLACMNGRFHDGKDIPKGVVGQVSMDGKIHGPMALLYVRAFRCTDPLCPECCLHWAKLQTGRALRRFERFNDAFPNFELRHVTVSIPRYLYNLGFKELEKEALVVAQAVGVVGGVSIYHPKRYNRVLKCWYFAPHFHLLGFVEDGRVNGKLVRDIHEHNGFVIKNLAKRKSLYFTLMYQLSHAGVPSGRQHAVVWFGECNYRKLAVVVSDVPLDRENKGRFCPICEEKLVHVCRVASAGDYPYRHFEEQFVLDDMFNWVIVPQKRRVKKDVYDGFKDEDDKWAYYNNSFE